MLSRYLFTLSLLFIFTACDVLEKEVKNNNTPIHALNTKIFKAPINIQGNFDNDQDKNYYPILIEKPGYYSIAVTQVKGFDIRLSVLNNKTKTILIADDYYKNFGEQIPNIFLKKQLYYVLVESKKQDFLSSNNKHISPNYTLIIQPFILNTHQKTFSLEKATQPSLDTLQTIYTNIKHFGFFQPTNDNNIKDPILEDIVKYIGQITKKDYKPYKLALYTFDIPKIGNFFLNLRISAVQDVDSSIAIFDMHTFNSIIKSQTLPTNSYSIIQDTNNYGEGEVITNHQIDGGKRYIVIIIGSNRLNYKSFLQAQKNYYELLFTLTPIDDKDTL